MSRGCKYNAQPDPGVQKMRACGLGQDQGMRPPHQARRDPQATGLGETKLQEAGRGEAPARHTKRGMRPGRRGPRTKAPGRARLAVPEPHAARSWPGLESPRGRCGRRAAAARLPQPPESPSSANPHRFQQFPKRKGGRGGGDSQPRRRADLVPEPLPDGSRTAGPGRRPAEGSRQRPCGGRRRTAGAGAPPCWCSPRSLAAILFSCLVAPRPPGRAPGPPPRPGPAPPPGPPPAVGPAPAAVGLLLSAGATLAPERVCSADRRGWNAAGSGGTKTMRTLTARSTCPRAPRSLTLGAGARGPRGEGVVVNFHEVLFVDDTRATVGALTPRGEGSWE